MSFGIGNRNSLFSPQAANKSTVTDYTSVAYHKREKPLKAKLQNTLDALKKLPAYESAKKTNFQGAQLTAIQMGDTDIVSKYEDSTKLLTEITNNATIAIKGNASRKTVISDRSKAIDRNFNKLTSLVDDALTADGPGSFLTIGFAIQQLKDIIAVLSSVGQLLSDVHSNATKQFVAALEQRQVNFV